MSKQELIFATQNKHKLQEIEAMLSNLYLLKTPTDFGLTEEIPETGQTLEANALQKARYVYWKLKRNCFADDTGLEVEALNGEPGVYSARYAGEEKDSNKNMELLLERLKSKENRKACFKTVIAMILGGKEYIFEGKVCGTITLEMKGINGFGYDPIFKPEGLSKTFGEMEAAKKNEMSHRARALEQLVDFLEKE
jgi:XTP/dITP diphosphohydrolase